jgi:hypothetical protein
MISDRIATNPKVMDGKPVIQGTRISKERLIRELRVPHRLPIHPQLGLTHFTVAAYRIVSDQPSNGQLLFASLHPHCFGNQFKSKPI